MKSFFCYIWPSIAMEPDDAVVQDSQVYFILEKYIITIHFWNHKNNHGTDVLTTHALSGFYNRYVFGFCGNMKRKQVSERTTSVVLAAIINCHTFIVEFQPLLRMKSIFNNSCVPPERAVCIQTFSNVTFLKPQEQSWNRCIDNTRTKWFL
jgi:hypothetical protein